MEVKANIIETQSLLTRELENRLNAILSDVKKKEYSHRGEWLKDVKKAGDIAESILQVNETFEKAYHLID